MAKIILHYFLSLLAFLTVDMVWLGLVAPQLYRSQIGHLMADTPSPAPAIIFYLLFVVGVLALVVYPTRARHIKHTAGYGALFGLITYATFDLTSMAVLRDWPLLITIVDMAWGTVLTSVTAVASRIVAERIRVK